MSVTKRWEQFRTVLIVEGKPYTALAMAPPQPVEKWAREALLTMPGIRVFLIDDMRNGGDEKTPLGVNNARLKRGMNAADADHRIAD
jgi:hypothetical protein